MIYLLYGTDLYSRNKQILKLTKGISPDSIHKFDFETTDVDILVNYCYTDSLLSEKQAIIVSNAIIFTGKKQDENLNLESLNKYLDHPNPNTVLIFSLDCEKIDSRKKILKKIEKNGKLINFQKTNNLNEFTKNLFKNYKITDSEIKTFIDIVGNNMNILELEAEKLKLYKEEEKIITKEDIHLVASKNIQPDLFGLVESIVNKDVKKSLELYENILLYNEEPIKIIVMIANQLRLIYQTKVLIESGLDINTIAKKLDIHPYRVKLALEKGYSYSFDEISIILKELAELDRLIKSGLVEKKAAFELFILKI